MDYTAIVIPVTKADKKIDQLDEGFEPLSEKDARNMDACEFGFSLIVSGCGRMRDFD